MEHPDRMTDHEILEAMDVYGGSFIQCLARLYRLADAANQQILKKSFRHYFDRYEALAAHVQSS